MIQTVADSDIRYDPEREDKDWRHRMLKHGVDCFGCCATWMGMQICRMRGS